MSAEYTPHAGEATYRARPAHELAPRQSSRRQRRIVSVAALVVGVAGVSTDVGPLVVASIAGLIGGAISMRIPPAIT